MVFSVFLPVRNGMPYIKECIDSILCQSYPHFELVVLDNASSDRTVEWIEGLDDKRIRIVKSDASLTIQESWARIKRESKQEFMTMIGHDDVFDIDFLQVINDLIIKNPDASLFQTGSRFIDSKGVTIRSCKPVPERETAAQYLRARLDFKRDVFGTGYVMRSKDYEEVGGIFNFEKLFFADDALWLSLTKISWKSSDPRETFSVRIHSKSESASLPSVWGAILNGLNQFNAFLKDFIKQDENSKKVYDDVSAGFLLSYHRNMLIFALIESSKKNVKISADVINKIEKSLAECAPIVSGELREALKVKAILMLNATVLRVLVPYFWGMYSFLKSKSLIGS